MKLMFLLIASLSLPLCATFSQAAETKTTDANVMVEFTLTSRVERRDPFNEVTLDAIFTEPGDKQRRVPAFWAGGSTWKVRYASPVVGEHRFRTESSDANDTDLHGVKGVLEVKPYTGDHPLYKHGPIRVAKDKRHFEHLDGTPFLWFGDTWWMGLTKRLSWPDDFKTLAADRKRKGFNLIQIIAGLYPDMPAFDPRGENEAGFPWEKDYARIRPEYFDAADTKVLYLLDQGFVPCIVGAWGYHLPWLGPERMRRHERYVYARWGALPMVWCVAGEVTLPYYLDPDHDKLRPKQIAGWEDVIRYCRSINAFDRIITAHPSAPFPMTMRANLKDPAVIDFDMLQTPHGQMEAFAPTIATVRHSYDAKPIMPVVNAEPSYEMLFDRTTPEVVRAMFWGSWTNGVGGYTYGANGIWQVNGRTQRYGPSPHGGDYGKIPWEDAMNLAGSTQVALGAKLLSEYAWHRFEPRRKWASWATTTDEAVPTGDWIWFPEGDPTKDAPVEPRYFRRSLSLPAGATVKRATLQIAADDRCTVWLNGEELGSHEDWRTPKRFDILAAKLRPGDNVLAVRAENGKAPVESNPAGLMCGMKIELANGHRTDVKSDAEWRVSKQAGDHWQEAAFDDRPWHQAKVIARYGDGPWGPIGGTADAFMVPHAMGIDREVRLVYVPQPKPIMVNALEADVRYAATYFDPATGERSDAGAVKPEADGSWRVEPPKFGHDWVLVMAPAK